VRADHLAQADGGPASHRHKLDAGRSTCSSISLGSVRSYDSPVSVAILAHGLPLVLIAAVSPVLFVNASRA